MASINDTTSNSSPANQSSVFSTLESLQLFGGSMDDYKKFSAKKSSPEEKALVAAFLPPRPQGKPINWGKLTGDEAQEFLRLFKLREQLFKEGKTLSQSSSKDHRSFLTLGNKVYLYERPELSQEEKDKRREKNQNFQIVEGLELE